MPYIKQERRAELDYWIERLAADIGLTPNPGDMNYVITRLLHLAWPKEIMNYSAINTVLGVLAAVSAEYYRRYAVPYEEGKIVLNGDVE